MTKDKPRIIISSYDDLHNPFYAGGGATAVHEVAKKLKGRFDISVVTGKYPGSRDEIIDSVAYRRIGTSRFGGKIGQLYFQLSLLFYIRRQIFDLLIENYTPPVSVSFLPFLTRKPVIGLAHMLSGVDMRRKYHLPFPLIENMGLRFYRYVITPSENDAMKIVKINHGAEIRIIPNGVNLPSLKKSSPKAEYISFLGRIEYDQKGLDLLLLAFGQVTQKTGLKLQIAGSGEKKEMIKLNRAISAFGLSDKVLIRGRITGSEKNEFMRNTLVMALPSRYETFSLSALEALSYGLPLVVFDLDGLKWIPSDCGIKVPCFSVTGFAGAILKLVKNPGLGQLYGLRGRKLAQKYTWGKAAEKYADFINYVLTRHG